MKRNVSLNDISDGRLYGAEDMVRADCLGCKGCSDCCKGMGNTIVLDPLDVYNLTTGLNKTFDDLVGDKIILSVVDGFVIPSLRMDEKTSACRFLDENGRCTIHAFRPGICRLFPLGRIYLDRGFKYFLQNDECTLKNRAKTKIKKVMEVPNLPEYERFVNTWHYFLKDLYEDVSAKGDENYIRSVSLGLIKHFYMTPYDSSTDFYKEFYKRLESIK